MHSMVLWSFLTLGAGVIVFVPLIIDSGHRSLAYWLIIPPLLAGVLAACSNLRIW
jgi:cytochrome c oxidase subunit IV